MTIAVSASSPELSGTVDPRFGRAPYFLFVETESMAFESEVNRQTDAASGVGIQVAQMIAGRGVDAVLTGSCGPNAFRTLQAAGIQVIVGVRGTVEQAVTEYREGRLRAAAAADVPSHHGMGRRFETGSGASPPAPQNTSLEDIKRQAAELRSQLAEINRKIDEFERKP